MKILCEKCGERLRGEICQKCGADNSVIYRTGKNYRPRNSGWIVTLILIAVLIGGFFASCVSCVVCPEAWSPAVKENRASILAYANEHYPNAKILSEHYPSAQFNPTGDPYDWIRFELDGVEFNIQCRHGEVRSFDDGYGEGLLRKQINEKYLDKFFSEHGTENIAKISFYYDTSSYWPGKDAKIKNFPGFIRLELSPEYEKGKPSPRDFGWFWEFYCYWKEVCPTKRFELEFFYKTDKESLYSLYCYTDSEFKDADDFFKNFEYNTNC